MCLDDDFVMEQFYVGWTLKGKSDKCCSLGLNETCSSGRLLRLKLRAETVSGFYRELRRVSRIKVTGEWK